MSKKINLNKKVVDTALSINKFLTIALMFIALLFQIMNFSSIIIVTPIICILISIITASILSIITQKYINIFVFAVWFLLWLITLSMYLG